MHARPYQDLTSIFRWVACCNGSPYGMYHLNGCALFKQLTPYGMVLPYGMVYGLCATLILLHWFQPALATCASNANKQLCTQTCHSAIMASFRRCSFDAWASNHSGGVMPSKNSLYFLRAERKSDAGVLEGSRGWYAAHGREHKSVALSWRVCNCMRAHMINWKKRDPPGSTGMGRGLW